MPRRRIGEEHIRNLTKLGGGTSYAVTIPMGIIREIGNWKVARMVMKKHGVDVCKAATLYMQAMSWAAELMPEMKG